MVSCNWPFKRPLSKTWKPSFQTLAVYVYPTVWVHAALNNLLHLGVLSWILFYYTRICPNIQSLCNELWKHCSLYTLNRKSDYWTHMHTYTGINRGSICAFTWCIDKVISNALNKRLLWWSPVWHTDWPTFRLNPNVTFWLNIIYL